jgi:sulfite reductase (NADPH) flavoprotein alpha-component
MSNKIAIYYGTMTGNSEALAREILDDAQGAGWDAAIYNLADVTPDDLATNAPNAIYIVSTWGDGEPPSDAVNFSEDIAKAAVDLAGVKHAVFGLGDSNYEQFCKFATDLDTRLRELGSNAVLDVAKGDVSYELDFAKWKPVALAAFGE